jgi:hypothetical protein
VAAEDREKDRSVQMTNAAIRRVVIVTFYRVSRGMVATRAVTT